jgi:hypothetical protein
MEPQPRTFKLPEDLRKRAPERKPTVLDLEIESKGTPIVGRSLPIGALIIDREWGAWIEPETPTDAQEKWDNDRSNSYVLVEKKKDGFHVAIGLNTLLDRGTRTEESCVESGLVPVKNVTRAPCP